MNSGNLKSSCEEAVTCWDDIFEEMDDTTQTWNPIKTAYTYTNVGRNIIVMNSEGDIAKGMVLSGNIMTSQTDSTHWIPIPNKETESTDIMNRHIEQIAHEAFSEAYKKALESEGGVTAVVDGVLYQIYSNGRREKIKEIPKRIELDPDKIYDLKS